MDWGPYVDHSPVPVQLGTSSDWKDFSLGYGFIAAVKNDGSLWVMGNNDWDHLGLEGYDLRTDFVPTIITSGAAKVFCGQHDTVVIMNDGSMWGFGRNKSTMLGSYQDFSTPKQMFSHASETYPGTQGWVSAALGDAFFIGVNSKGEVWGKGIGNGGNGYSSVFMLMAGGANDNGNEFTLLGTVNGWAGVSVDLYCVNSLFLHSTGNMFACGSNYLGGTGVAKRTDGHQALPELSPLGVGKKVIAVSAGDDVGFAIVEDTTPGPMPTPPGGVYGFGRDLDCDFGFPHDMTPYASRWHMAEKLNTLAGKVVTDCALGNGGVVFVTSEKKMYGFGHPNALGYADSEPIGCGECKELPGDGWAKVFMGAATGTDENDINRLLAIKDDGTLWRWATDHSGPVQLAGTDWEDVFIGRSGATAYYLSGVAYAVKTNGDLYALGPAYYSFSEDGPLLCSEPTFVCGGVKKVSIGLSSTLILMQDGSVYGAGSNSYYGLAQPNSSSTFPRFIEITEAPTCIDVCADEYATFYVSSDGTVYFTGFDHVMDVVGATAAPFIRPYPHIPIKVNGLVKDPTVDSEQLWMLDQEGAVCALGNIGYEGPFPLHHVTPCPGLSKIVAWYGGSAIILSKSTIIPNFWTNFAGQTEIL